MPENFGIVPYPAHEGKNYLHLGNKLGSVARTCVKCILFERTMIKYCVTPWCLHKSKESVFTLYSGLLRKVHHINME